MTTTFDAERLGRLYDSAGGVINPAVWTDQEIYEAELDRIFGRAWMLLCPAAQIPKPGDFFVTYVGADRVIVVRQKDGSVSALLNQCRHRGNELERADHGTKKMFSCSYHGWSYDLSGKLCHIPHEEVLYPEGFDKSAWGCMAMAQVDTYKGLVFGTWDPTAPSLLEYLGDAAWYADMFLDRGEGGLQLMGGVNKWIVKTNWKLVADQFTWDLLHPEIAHVSAFIAVMPPDVDASDMQLPQEGLQFTSPGGHGFCSVPGGGPVADAVAGKLARDYWVDSYDDTARRIGDVRAGIDTLTMTLFPSCIMFAPANQLRIAHPTGPNETEIWTWHFVPAAAPEDVKRSWALHTTRGFGAGGLFEPDDSTAWQGIQRTLRGAVGRRTPLAISMGHRRDEGRHPDYPGRITNPFSEVAVRGFYDRWFDLLTHDTWSELDEAAAARFAEGARQ